MTRTRAVIAQITALCSLPFVACAPTYAGPETYVLNSPHSRIFFDTSHQGFSVMQGMFRVFDGVFRFDPNEPTNSTIDITISAASVDMFDDDLNDHLLTDHFFGAANYPELRFVSTGIKKLDANLYRVEGSLTLLGVCQPISFEATQNRFGEQTGQNASGLKVGFSARGTLDRSKFGMTYALPGIGRDVAFRLEIEAVQATQTQQRDDSLQRGRRVGEDVRC